MKIIKLMIDRMQERILKDMENKLDMKQIKVARIKI